MWDKAEKVGYIFSASKQDFKDQYSILLDFDLFDLEILEERLAGRKRISKKIRSAQCNRTKKRGQLNAILKNFKKGGRIYVESIKHLGDTVGEISLIIYLINLKGLYLISYEEKFDTSKPRYQEIINLFEEIKKLKNEELIHKTKTRKRQRKGIEDAKKQGKHLGRPKKVGLNEDYDNSNDSYDPDDPYSNTSWFVGLDKTIHDKDGLEFWDEVEFDIVNGQYHKNLKDIPTLLEVYADKCRSEGSLYNSIVAINGTLDRVNEQVLNKQRKIKEKQTEGIKRAQSQGKHLGRPAIDIGLIEFEVYKRYEDGEITLSQALKELGFSRSTFYKMRRRFCNSPHDSVE